MTISDQLIAINTAKTNIKNAIEAKGVTVGAAPFADYAGKIDAITGGGPTITIPTPKTWVRPSDWLPLKVLGSTELGCSILLAVFPFSTEFSFSISGGYTVDWGDGVIESKSGTASHNYSYESLPTIEGSTRLYKQVVINIAPNSGQRFMNFSTSYVSSDTNSVQKYSNILDIRLYFGAATDTTASVISISKKADLYVPACVLLEHAEIKSVVSSGTAKVSLANALSGANSLRSVEVDVSNRSISTVASMFEDCQVLASLPALNTTGCTDFSNFAKGCAAIYTLPNYDYTSATTLTGAYQNCRSLMQVGNISSPSATDWSNLFYGCSSLITVGDLSTTNATNLSGLFRACTSLTTFSALNTANATNMSYMYSGTNVRTGPALSSTNKCTDFSYMFYQCSLIEEQPAYDYSNATLVNDMFSNCPNLKTVNTLTFPKATSAARMFALCTSLESVPTINMPLVTSCSSFFSNSNNLQVVPTINIDQDFDGTAMFINCSSITSFRNQPTLRVSNATNMFAGCSSLIYFDMTNFGIKSPASAYNMFSSMFALRKVYSPDHTGTPFRLELGSTQMSASEVESTCRGVSAYSSTMTITGSPAASGNVSVSKTSTKTTLGSNLVVVTSNTSLITGMETPTASLSTISGTADTATNTFTTAYPHLFSNGDEVATTASVAGTTLRVIYRIINATSTTFQISTTLGGSPVTLTANSAVTFRFANYISSISGTDVTMRYPANATSTTLSASFRNLKTFIAVMKGWTVTG